MSVVQRWLGNGEKPISKIKGKRANRSFLREPMTIFSLIVILTIILGAVLAPVLTSYPEEGQGAPNIINKFLQPGGGDHVLGTDNLGRDIFARILYGGRVSLSIGALVVVVAILIGVPLGALAGFFGGWLDELIMRITDIFLAFPPLLLAIILASAMKRGFLTMVLSIGITWWPWYSRLVRAQVISLRERSFVDAARCMGISNLKIITRHILPNTLAPVMVQATMDIGSAILTAAGLSFLGLGLPPPTADWGSMVSEGRLYFLSHWWFATFPGLVIFFTVLSLNLLGDAVRDWFDPRTRAKQNE